MPVGNYIGGSINDPGTAYANLPRQYGLPTNFGYGPAIPNADVFNRALAGMVGQLGQNVGGFTEGPMAGQAASAYTGQEDELNRLFAKLGIGQNPSLEAALRGNYQQSLMGIPGAGTAAQIAQRQKQIEGLNQFPAAVGGSLANLQSAKLEGHAAEDERSRQQMRDIGMIVGDVGKVLLGGSLGSSLGGMAGGAGAGGGLFNSALNVASRGYNRYAPSGSPVSTLGSAGGGVPDYLRDYLQGATLV